jgi:hypothetical protein
VSKNAKNVASAGNNWLKQAPAYAIIFDIFLTRPAGRAAKEKESVENRE